MDGWLGYYYSFAKEFLDVKKYVILIIDVVWTMLFHENNGLCGARRKSYSPILEGR